MHMGTDRDKRIHSIYMKTLLSLPLLIILTISRAGAIIIWDEAVSGDLPSSLGVLQPGTNTVLGAVGVGGGYGTGQFIDSDWVQFQVPTGMLLDRFLVRAVSSGSYLAFGLDRGAVVGQDTVGFGLFYPSSTPVDLLQFGSALGPQPAMGYIFSVSPGGSTEFQTYSLDIVITPVPEPQGVVLLCLGSVVFTICGRRLSWDVVGYLK
jgi:hypothetical protein